MKRKQQSSFSYSLKALSNTGYSLYALAEFGETYAKNKLSHHALSSSIVAINREIREAFDGAIERLPKPHKAREHVRKAIAALDSLNTLVGFINESSDSVGSNPFRTAIGEVILFYTAKIGREME